MSFGLLIRNNSGQTLIDGDTFTVRLIATLHLPAGVYSSEQRISCASARLGMFAVGTPLKLVPLAGAYRVGGSATPGEAIIPHVTRMPTLSVSNGEVICKPSDTGVSFDGNVDIMVMAYT